jgi:hypothetical protein
MKIEENLDIIASIALEKAVENTSFATYLKAQDANEIDLVVERLNATITPQVSCTDCGQCCRSMRPEASYEAMSPFVTDENYEAFKYLKGITCKHLVDSKCTVYLERQQVCKDFPYMDVPGFSGRTVGIFQNYEICPIVFNIVEHLKVELDWSDK